MKLKALKVITLIAKVASVAGYIGGLLDPTTAATVFAASSVAKDIANRIGDQLDDGKPNNSFKA